MIKLKLDQAGLIKLLLSFFTFFLSTSSFLFASPYSENSYPPQYGGYIRNDLRDRTSSYSPMLSINFDEKAKRNTALRVASNEDRILDVIELIKQGADVNSVSDNGMTALMYTARACHPRIAQKLLEKDLKINAQDRYGRTALMYAIKSHCESVAKMLSTKKNINLTLIDIEGRSAINYAESSFLFVDMLKEAQRKKSTYAGQ